MTDSKSTDWWVELGVPQDQSRFREILKSVPFSVVERAERCFLVLPCVQGLNDLAEVYDRCRVTIELVNHGIRTSSLKEDELVVKRICQVEEDGSLRTRVLSDPVEVPVETNDPIIEDGIEANRIANRARYIQLMLNSTTAPLMVSLAEGDLPHVSMYNIVEGICFDLGKTMRKGKAVVARFGWLTEGDLNRLTRCLTHRSASGLDARHVFGSSPAPSQPLTLSEMRNMVRHLYRKWIAWKASGAAEHEHAVKPAD